MTLINNILLRPQMFEERQLPAQADIPSILMDTAGRLLKDARGDKAILNHMWELAKESFYELLAQISAQLTSSLSELMAMIQPILDAIQEFAEAAGAADPAEGFVNVLGLLVDKVVALSDSFSLDKLQEILRKLATILNNTLGLTDGRLAGIMEQAVDHITEGLMAAYLEGDYTQSALDSFMVGSNIHRLKNYFKGFIQTKNIAFDLLPYVDRLIGMLRTKGIDAKLQQIKDYVQTIGGGASFIGSLSGSLSVSFNSPSEEPEDPVGWYISWFKSKWINVPEGVVGRNVLEDWKIPLQDNPTEDAHYDMSYKRIAFKKPSLTPQTMECAAQVAYYLGDFVEALCHLIFLENKPYISSSYNAILEAAKGLLTVLMGPSTSTSWVKAYKYIGANWFDYGFQLLGTFLFSWIPEGNLRLNNQNALYYFLGGIRSMAELSFILNYTWLARESVLSILTLLNHDPALAATTDNSQKIFGLWHLVGDVGAWIGATFGGRDHFGLADGEFMGWVMLGAIPAFVLPIPLIEIPDQMGGRDATDPVFPHLLLQGLIMAIVKSFLYYNIMWEGNTDGGKYNGFLGYPPKDSSPYLMPMANGKEIGIVQGNLGFFSHNKDRDLIYAYDFTHDFRDEILAIRAGTASFSPDDELFQDDKLQDSGNSVYVNHTNGIDPLNDRGPSGVLRQTWAKYYHGAHMGVSHAFALYGIPLDYIDTSPVRQGQVVMFAGNTGNSGHNHLHLDVGMTGAGTIPFVFRDAPGDGVPKTARFYTGTQTRVPNLASASYPCYHPEKEYGTTADVGGTNTVKLANTASPHDDAYNGSFIVVTWTDNGMDFGQYRKITDYDGDSQVVTVDSAWDHIPAASANYRVGSPVRAEASAFEKVFAFWGMGGGAPFADGAPVYTYVNIARYQRIRLTGTVASTPAPTANTIQISPATVVDPATMAGRFIVIKNNGVITAYKEITNYTAATQIVQIVGTWGTVINNTDTYEIGGQTFTAAPLAEKRLETYYCNDSTPGTHSPIDFPGGIPSAKYLSYKAAWT